MSDKYNPNEYRVYETNGAEYSIYGAKYTLKKNVATFWYWRKNLNNRYELVSFERKGVKSVSLVLGDPGETGYGLQDAPWDGWKTILLFLVFLLAACNPYESLPAPTPTAQPTGTATKSSLTLSNLITPTPTPQTCTVSTGIDSGKLNVRSDAGTSYAVIRVLREGQAVTLTDESPRGNWIQITTGHGWINQKFCIRRISHE